MVAALHRWPSQGVNHIHPSRLVVFYISHPWGVVQLFLWWQSFTLLMLLGENRGGAQDCLSPFYQLVATYHSL